MVKASNKEDSVDVAGGAGKNKNAVKPVHGEALQNQGQITPAPTPEVEADRVQADSQRRHQKAGDGGTFSATRDQPPDVDEGSSSETDVIQVIQAILSCGKDQHRDVLGISEKEEHIGVIEGEFWQRGTKIHPKYNKNPKAEEAFKRVIEAGTALKCDPGFIKELEEWEGDGSGDTDDDEQDPMDGVETEIPAPHVKIKELYAKATPYMRSLQQDPGSESAIKNIQTINNKIRDLNRKDEIDESQWLIKYEELIGFYEKAKPCINRINLSGSKDATANLQTIDNELKVFCEKQRYAYWNIDPSLVHPPKPKSSKKKASSNKGGQAGQPSNGTEEVVPSIEATSSGQSGSGNTHIGTQENAAASTGINWPWTTGISASEKRIMGTRAHGKEGKDGRRGHRCMVETDPGVPIFTIQSGSDTGLMEVESYLNMEGRLELGSKSKKDGRTWDYRHRLDFKSLDWVANAPYKVHNPYSKSGGRRTPETWCGVTWKWGPEELPASAFQKVLGATSADAKIRAFYAKYNRTPPGDLTPIHQLTKAEVDKIRDRQVARQAMVSSEANAVDQTNVNNSAEGRGRSRSRSRERGSEDPNRRSESRESTSSMRDRMSIMERQMEDLPKLMSEKLEEMMSRLLSTMTKQ